MASVPGQPANGDMLRKKTPFLHWPKQWLESLMLN